MFLSFLFFYKLVLQQKIDEIQTLYIPIEMYNLTLLPYW